MTVRLGIDGNHVESVDVEHALTLRLSGGAEIRVEVPFDLAEQGAASETIDPEDISVNHVVWELFVGKVVESATAVPATGGVVVALHGGLTLQVLPDPDFEAWSVTWPDGRLVVALPGGGLAVWGARA